MRQLLHKSFDLKAILFVACVSWSAIANGQTAAPAAPPAPAAATAADDDMDGDTTSCCAHATKNGKCDSKFIVGTDFGGATIFTSVKSGDGSVNTATGLSWAVSGQFAHQFKVNSKSTRLFLSFGLDLRNFNGTVSSPDGFGSTAYDNYHYWYAGVPVTFQVVDVKHSIGNFDDVGFYAEAGVELGFKLNMLDVYSIQGDNTWMDVTGHYNTLMVNQFASAGVAYRTRYNTFLFGPYVGYVLTNISNDDGVKKNVLSFGIRLSAMLFK